MGVKELPELGPVPHPLVLELEEVLGGVENTGEGLGHPKEKLKRHEGVQKDALDGDVEGRPLEALDDVLDLRVVHQHVVGAEDEDGLGPVFDFLNEDPLDGLIEHEDHDENSEVEELVSSRRG